MTGTSSKLPATKPRKPRATDGGSEILSDMENTVSLIRKIKNRPLLKTWLELMCQSCAVLDIDWESTKPTDFRKGIFNSVATLPGGVRQRIEEACQRILLLSDTYGVEPVQQLLEGDSSPELVEADKYLRSLLLYVRRLQNDTDRRFERAETARQQNKQWKSEAYSSHYRGPKDVEIVLDDKLKESLKEAVGEIYPKAGLDDVVIEHFQRRALNEDVGDDDVADGKATWLHTIVVDFNGKETHWDKVVDGEVLSKHDQALQRIIFAYEPSSGALSVFCDDKKERRNLARALCDSVLTAEGEIGSMPLREFDLQMFGSEKVLDLLKPEASDGVEAVAVNLIKVAKTTEQMGETTTLSLASDLTVRRDRRDQRSLYKVARVDYGLQSLSGWEVRQVKLGVRLSGNGGQRARNISVQITEPNGLNDTAKSEAERQLVMRLLKRWNIVTEF